MTLGNPGDNPASGSMYSNAEGMYGDTTTGGMYNDTTTGGTFQTLYGNTGTAAEYSNTQRQQQESVNESIYKEGSFAYRVLTSAQFDKTMKFTVYNLIFLSIILPMVVGDVMNYEGEEDGNEGGVDNEIVDSLSMIVEQLTTLVFLFEIIMRCSVYKRCCCDFFTDQNPIKLNYKKGANEEGTPNLPQSVTQPEWNLRTTQDGYFLVGRQGKWNCFLLVLTVIFIVETMVRPVLVEDDASGVAFTILFLVFFRLIFSSLLVTSEELVGATRGNANSNSGNTGASVREPKAANPQENSQYATGPIAGVQYGQPGQNQYGQLPMQCNGQYQMYGQPPMQMTGQYAQDPAMRPTTMQSMQPMGMQPMQPMGMQPMQPIGMQPVQPLQPMQPI